MKKGKILLYAALIAIIFGGTPYFIGYLVETKFKDVVMVLPSINPHLETQVVEYKRGWLRSYAKTKVTLKNVSPAMAKAMLGEQAGAFPFTATLEHHIQHGPFIKTGSYKDWTFARALIHTNLFLQEKSKEIIREAIGQTDLFDLTNVFKMNGAVLFKLDGKRIENKKPTESILWDGVQGVWELNPQMTRLQGEMVCPALDYIWANGRLLMHKLVIKSDLQKASSDLWLNQAQVDLQDIKLIPKANTNESFSVEKIVAKGSQTLRDELVDVYFDLQIGKLLEGKDVYGPITVKSSLKNLQLIVYKTLLEIQGNHNILGNDALLLQKLMPLLPEVIKTRPVLSIEDLQAQTPHGLVKGAFTLAIGGNEVTNKQDFGQLFDSISAKGSFSIPKVLLQNILKDDTAVQTPAAPSQNAPIPSQEAAGQALINTWINQGYIAEKGQNYVLDFTLDKGKILVNGKELNFSTQQQTQLPAN